MVSIRIAPVREIHPWVWELWMAAMLPYAAAKLTALLTFRLANGAPTDVLGSLKP
jgi:hypothetical protein